MHDSDRRNKFLSRRIEDAILLHNSDCKRSAGKKIDKIARVFYASYHPNSLSPTPKPNLEIFNRDHAG